MHFSCGGERNCQIKSEQEETQKQTDSGKGAPDLFISPSLRLHIGWYLLKGSFAPFDLNRNQAIKRTPSTRMHFSFLHFFHCMMNLNLPPPTNESSCGWWSSEAMGSFQMIQFTRERVLYFIIVNTANDTETVKNCRIIPINHIERVICVSNSLFRS